MIRPLPVLTLAALALAAPARGEDEATKEADDCLTCHDDAELKLELGDGASVSLEVKREHLARSIHADLKCTECHPGLDEVPHAERQYANAAELRASFHDACKQCHFDKYTQTFDSVHFKKARGGPREPAAVGKSKPRLPTCIDCHGAHQIGAASRPRSRISETCAHCHEAIYKTYAASVHGKALVEGANQDVPVCTDCHSSHDIPDPKGEAWLVRTPEICGKCHADEKLMGRYGLSTAVLKTYLADFHGATTKLSAARGSDRVSAPRVTALCIDCHGVHDIAKVKDPGSQVFKANLVKTCRKCHEQASDSFPAAWLSHYEPTWKKAPLVYAVTVAYGILIPFIIGGLCLQILLHLWRVVVNR